MLMGEGIQNVCDLFSSSFPWGSNFDVADLSPIHFRKQAAIDGTYVSKYLVKPGFGFDSGPNLQP